MDAFAPFGETTYLWLDQLLVKPNEVFITDVKGDDLFAAYLAAFPAGTNPIVKTRTDHDCNCCKQFVRNVGMVVRLHPDGSCHTVWDEAARSNLYPYALVAKVLQEIVLKAKVVDRFILDAKFPRFGKDVTRSLDPNTNNVKSLYHFYTGDLPKAFLSTSVGTELNRYRTAAQVMERGLNELTTEAIDMVSSLIEANSLYRGEEHRNAVAAFHTLHQTYHALPVTARNHFIWRNTGNPAAMFKNTVIGTLVQDLSEGKDVEQAVRAFEHKVAPTNYKRTTALVTPGMVQKALTTIRELGLEEALERRFARIEDVSVNDVLWVDSSVKPLMKGGLEGTLMAAVGKNAPKASAPEAAEDITLSDFMTRIVPETTSMDIWFSNDQVGNMMSITAPIHPEPKQLFKWDNDFAWSYGGNVTDSIKERVKKAGGRVDNVALRVSLSWYNYDDLDLHVHGPKGLHIFFGNRKGATGGHLDVDMNVGPGGSREAVENIMWADMVPNGEYTVSVNNFNQRETSDVGFVLEVENQGNLIHYAFNKMVKNKDTIMALNLTLKDNKITRCDIVDSSIVASTLNQEKWGLTTNAWVKVNTIMLSPNYWGNNAVGNKHTFFVVDGAHNNEPCRGIYNEFLNNKLESHRKVFELIGDKTKCVPTENQLSGLGFSSTRHVQFKVKVKQGNRQRIFNVSTT